MASATEVDDYMIADKTEFMKSNGVNESCETDTKSTSVTPDKTEFMESNGVNESCETGTKSTRKSKSRVNAQSRRTTHAHLLKELGTLLPFAPKVVQQIDYNSILRLVLCYFRMKNMATQDGSSQPMNMGKVQNLMTEALDGFVMVVLGDGTLVYLSDNIHKYLGLFQSEHIGANLFDLIFIEDQKDVKESLKQSEVGAMSNLAEGSPCSFFCRMKCPKFKMAMCAAKTPGYKLMYVSGRCKMDGSAPRLVAVGRPVSPPSILEIRMEGNMFVTHYQLDMRCTFFDGRLQNLLGYTKTDMMGKLAFDLHHHEDIQPCQECHSGLLKRGEGVSGYYRMLNKQGEFIWCQTRAHMMFDSRSGKPSYIVCMNFVISKDKGEESLAQREIDAANSKEKPSAPNRMDHSYDPFPVTSNEWAGRDPYAEEGVNNSSASASNRSSPQEELDSTATVSAATTVIRTPSPPVDAVQSPNSNSTFSPQSSVSTFPDQGSVTADGGRNDSVFLPFARQSVGSIESGYDSGMSLSPMLSQQTAPNNANPIRSMLQPEFQAHSNARMMPVNNDALYYQQIPQMHFAPNTVAQPTFQTAVPFQFSAGVMPTTNVRVKKEPFQMQQQCFGIPQTQMHQETRPVNVDPILGIDNLMSLLSDQIPSIAPAGHVKMEASNIIPGCIPNPVFQPPPALIQTQTFPIQQQQQQQQRNWPNAGQHLTHMPLNRKVQRNGMFVPQQVNQTNPRPQFM